MWLAYIGFSSPLSSLPTKVVLVCSLRQKKKHQLMPFVRSLGWNKEHVPQKGAGWAKGEQEEVLSKFLADRCQFGRRAVGCAFTQEMEED